MVAQDRIFVWCTTRFAALHRWKEAPEIANYLRDFHRHEFHVKVIIEVDRSRQIEFIHLKNQVDSYIRQNYEGQRLDKSCEDMASEILRAFHAHSVEINEDGENGATVVREIIRDETGS